MIFSFGKSLYEPILHNSVFSTSKIHLPQSELVNSEEPICNNNLKHYKKVAVTCISVREKAVCMRVYMCIIVCDYISAFAV